MMALAALDGMDVFWKLAAVLLLVCLNGFFVAAEFALVKIRETQLGPLVAKGSFGARVALTVVQNLDASLSACQLGITLASLGLGWIGEPVFTALLEPVMQLVGIESLQVRHTLSFIFGFSVLTFLHITAGEQAPKWFAIQRPLSTSMWIALPLRAFHKISYPFIWVLNHSSLWMLRQLGLQPAHEGEWVESEDELKLILSSALGGKGSGHLSRNILLNAMDLKARVVRDAMRPRREIVPLDTRIKIEDCMALADKTRFSRFPLCENGDLDRTLGVVHVKDLYSHRTKAVRAADLTGVARKLIYIPETARLERLLQLFLDRRLHFAIVVDEYGTTVGMITIENILEELVGPIQDEFDQEKPLMEKLDEQSWRIDGSLALHELSEIVGESLTSDGVTTVSGWVTQRAGGFPRAGFVVDVGRFSLQVRTMDGPRVEESVLTRKPLPPSD